MFGLFKKRAQSPQHEAQPSDPIEDLWAWVVENRSALVSDVESFGTARATTALAIEKLGSRLRQIDPGLAHEIGMADPQTLDIVVSAEGTKALFPLVIEVVNRVPKVAGLKATAFRQRNPGLSLEVLGHKVTAETVSYVSIVEGDKLGLDLFFDIDLDERGRVMIGFLLLDMTLGEYDVGTRLGSIEFREGRAPAGAKPLSALAEQVDAAQHGMRH